MSEDIKKRVGALFQNTKQYLEDKGVTQKVDEASKYAGDHFDTVSGIKQFKLVEERLELQNQYNDILAQKLEEALSRISELETHLKKVA